MKKHIALILVAAMIMALAAGCGGGTKIPTKQGDVSVSKDSVSFEGKDGTKSNIDYSEDGDGVSLPEGYPADLVPIMDDTKIELASSTLDNGKKVFTVFAKTTEPYQDVCKYYENVMKDSTEPIKTQAAEMSSIFGVKNSQQIQIIITAPENNGDDKATSINIGISPKN